ncbi:MAG: hypothetical protein U5L02_16585 [Rheinheimera sp.]|nr:hypothetical protein [Rheinheimera sp.]
MSAEDRQKSQGTGTVLGDDSAKSESIANALGRIEDLELDQYAELRSINGSIRELSAGIKNLAVNLVASYGKFNESSYPGELGKEYNLQLGSGLASVVGGGVIGLVADKLLGGLVGGLTNKLLGGLFGSKKTELVDSGLSFVAQELGDIISSGLMNATVYDVIKTTKKKLFGLSKSTSESTEYRAIDNALRAEFSRIFSHMGKSVTEAVNLLGLETNKTLESFVINLPALSFKDLKGDEIEKELQAMFSQQGDLMVQYLVPGIAEFQQIGEGLYDTLIRVAQEQAVFNSALDNLGLQLGRFAGVTKAIELEVAQSIIELMGGIEQFQSATADYFAEFYSEQEQLAAITKSATAQFASLGVAMPTSRDGFKSLVDSLDLTTDAGQRMFAALMALVPAMDQFYDAAERARREAEEAAEKARKEAEAKAEAARKQAEDRAAYTSDLQSQLARLDMSSLEIALDDIKKWYDAQIKEARELGASTALLEQLYTRKRQQIIDSELDKINQDTARQLEQLTGEHERAVSELTSHYDQLFSAIKTAGDAIGSAILEIKRGMAGWDESGYQSGRIGDLRSQLGAGDITAQVKTIEQLQAAIVARFQSEMAGTTAAMDAANSRLESLTANFSELQSALGSARDGITAAILDIRRSMAGFDESGYQTGRIGALRNQLGAGSVLEQINTIEQLQSAIVSRYQAELNANTALQSAANERYQAELSAHKALADAARALLSAADALRISDLSPALMGEQLNTAQSQFNTLLNAARGGDADAMRQLQSAGTSYLGLAKNYYASGSSEYAAIFAQVEQAYRSFAGMAGSAEPVVPRAVLDYQSASNALQQSTINELEALQTLLTALDSKAKAEQSAAEAAARAEIAAQQARQLGLQQAAIDELSALQTLLDGLAVQADTARQAEMAALLSKVDEQKAALLDAAERQIAAIKALAPVTSGPVLTNPQPVTPIVIPPWETPPIIIQPPKDDRIWLPEQPGDPRGTTQMVTLLQQQLAEQQKANAQQQRQMARMTEDLQRTQTMLFEVRRQA